MFFKHHKKIGLIIMSIVFVFIFLFLIALRTKAQVKSMFKLNKELQQEGYYMGDFEFKMLGTLYLLDKGHYLKALLMLNDYHKQLQSRNGLLKVPDHADKEAELNFYLNLQDPQTGAFMDSRYPYPTYNEPTENLVNHIASISEELGRPLELKYPLKYLDEINTPEKLNAFLDDVSYVGKISTKFPQTSYVFARSILSFINGEDAISKNGLYHFSPEWEKSLLEWFYKNQDPKSGFWGPRLKKSHELLDADLNNTASIIKAFADKNGNDLYENFPLRYKSQMFLTAIRILSEPMPPKDALDEIHEWNLKMDKGIAMLTRYLLPDVSIENKEKAKKIISDYIQVKFENNYIPDEGAFSYYPNESQASLDGTSNIFLFKDVGAFSREVQIRLWGEDVKNLGNYKIRQLDQKSLYQITSKEKVNSIRVYSEDPMDDYLKNIEMAFYPRETIVLDIFELTPKILSWLKKTPSTMGNWTSKEKVLEDIEKFELKEINVFKDQVPIEEMNNFFKKNHTLTLIGFDKLQIPITKITFELENQPDN